MNKSIKYLVIFLSFYNLAYSCSQEENKFYNALNTYKEIYKQMIHNDTPTEKFKELGLSGPTPPNFRRNSHQVGL